MLQLAPSILSSDFAHLADQVRLVTAGGATLLHVDVMDGHFVPNITIGPPVVASLRKVTELPLDVHLMIENADRYIPDFVAAGADWITVHQEACVHLHRTVQLIRQSGALPGVAINPATPVHMLDDILDSLHLVLVMSVNPGFGGQQFIPRALDKIAKLALMREERGLDFRIEVDGGISTETVAAVVRAGAEVLVAGSAVFGKGDPQRNAEHLLKAALDATLLQA